MSQAATVRRTAKGFKPGGSQGDESPPTDVAVPSAPAPDRPDDPDRQDFAPGDLIGERQRYELTAHLGRGSMGTVFLAKDKLEEKYKERDPYVAIKFLDSEFASHPQARIALEREAKKAKNLAHPNIVKVFYFDEFRSIPYMVMEYIRGMPLDDFLHRYPEGMPFEEAWPIVRDIGQGLAYIHNQSFVDGRETRRGDELRRQLAQRTLADVCRPRDVRAAGTRSSRRYLCPGLHRLRAFDR